ncbi:hypothetical protein HOT49_gp089 [Erwinia phage vB_EamM_Alexandra]|uniref:Uncharacterized protein n=1 Tax=Erwinia phage vB_EamM_Alexandra TaxID=2201424 RepID=A0A2Z4QDM5_9CAUD|nr:hypothetical protein HOT49_gp089 [Erwinia phage vB_EamM_Alexandra]AWY08365.1 hypothetical protein Alexandra_89 [Erwinia phage vB_EamM_Alexandra]
MNYKLFANSVVPQLSRLFSHATADDKSCYLVKLNSGFVEADLNKCLNFQAATGAGYVFDAALAASSGICTVLAKGTNCVRSISRTKLSISDCQLTATAEGVPTHLILGGILPICLQVGPDVTLLYPDLVVRYDPNGYKTQVTINAFSVNLTQMWAETSEVDWLTGTEQVAFSFSNFNTGSFTDLNGNAVAVTGNAKPAADGLGVDLGTNGLIAITTVATFDPSKSFTIECDYHQTGNADYAEWSLFRSSTSLSDRFTISFDRSNERGLVIWNNVGGGSAGVKVARAISPYAALWGGSVVHLKYEYDDVTATHTVSINGAVVDTFTYRVLKPVGQGVQITGGYGGGNAAYTPIIDNYALRQGA